MASVSSSEVLGTTSNCNSIGVGGGGNEKELRHHQQQQQQEQRQQQQLLQQQDVDESMMMEEEVNDQDQNEENVGKDLLYYEFYKVSTHKNQLYLKNCKNEVIKIFEECKLKGLHPFLSHEYNMKIRGFESERKKRRYRMEQDALMWKICDQMIERKVGEFEPGESSGGGVIKLIDGALMDPNIIPNDETFDPEAVKKIVKILEEKIIPNICQETEDFAERRRLFADFVWVLNHPRFTAVVNILWKQLLLAKSSSSSSLSGTTATTTEGRVSIKVMLSEMICFICGQKTNLLKKQNHEHHIMICHGPLVYACPICVKKSKSTSALRRHIQEHDENLLSMICLKCFKRFETEEEKTQHFQDVEACGKFKIVKKPRKRKYSEDVSYVDLSNSNNGGHQPPPPSSQQYRLTARAKNTIKISSAIATETKRGKKAGTTPESETTTKAVSGSNFQSQQEKHTSVAAASTTSITDTGCFETVEMNDDVIINNEVSQPDCATTVSIEPNRSNKREIASSSRPSPNNQQQSWSNNEKILNDTHDVRGEIKELKEQQQESQQQHQEEAFGNDIQHNYQHLPQQRQQDEEVQVLSPSPHFSQTIQSKLNSVFNADKKADGGMDNSVTLSPVEVGASDKFSGSLNKVNRLDPSNLFDGLKLVISESSVGFLKAQANSPCNNGRDFDGYTVANVLTRIPIANYQLQLSANFPSRGEDGSLLSYDPKEMADIGKDLQKGFMEEMKRIMDLQQYSIRGILAATLKENKVSLHVNQIVKNYEEDLQKYLEESDFGNDADVLKLHDDLKADALASLPNKDELEGSGGDNEGLLLEMTKVLESEIERKKPNPEEVWHKKAEAIMEGIKTSHRDFLELAKDENLEKAHTSIKKFAFLELNARNPFAPNSEWRKRLEERVNEELESVLVEVRNKTQKNVNNLVSGPEPGVSPATGIEDEYETLSSGSKVGAQQALDRVDEEAKTYLNLGEMEELKKAKKVEGVEPGPLFLEPRDHLSDAPPMRETRSMKYGATSEAGGSFQAKRPRSPAQPREKRAHKILNTAMGRNLNRNIVLRRKASRSRLKKGESWRLNLKSVGLP